MTATGYRQSLPITDAASLLDMELPDPTPTGRDLRIEVRNDKINLNPTKTSHR